MRVTVKVHGHFRQTSAVGQDELTFTLPDAGGLRIRDLLEGLNIFEEEIREVLLDGKRTRLAKPLRGRVRVEFFPKRR